jgi:hypothetical protein
VNAISSFWTNTIWFVVLGAITIIEIVVSLIRAEKRGQAVGFFLTILGVTLTIETTILIFMKAYSYYPLIFTKTGNPFDDSLAGNLFSQLFVSATMLLAIVFKLKPYWYVIFGVINGLLEELFLAFGIYSHNWYQTWMTIVLFPILFLMAKIMYMKLQQSMRPMFYYGYIFLALFPINIALHFPLMLTRIQDMNYYVLSDTMMSRHFIVLVLFFVVSASLMGIYFARLKLYWKASVITALEIFYYVAYRMNFIQIKEGWFFPVSIATILWMYLSIYMLDRLYGKLLKNLQIQ